jgi:hypothetical protein
MEPATVEQRRADAIGLIAECALRSGLVMEAQADAAATPARPDRPALANRVAGIGSADACSESRAAGAVSGDTGTPGHASDALSHGSDAMSCVAGAVSGDSGAVGRKTVA